jgi:putative membrane protein
MPSFIDPLTLILDLMVLVAVAVFYTGALVWWHTRHTEIERARQHLRAGGAMLTGLGAIFLVLGLWGEMVWPLPGSYNLLFFDSIVMLAFVLIAFGALTLLNLPTQFAGVLSLVAGAGVIYYGWRAYQIGLTNSPIEMFLLYLGFGAAGILAYPATLFADLFVLWPARTAAEGTAPSRTMGSMTMWTAVLALFLVVLVLAGVAAIVFGFNTAWAHLENPP